MVERYLRSGKGQRVFCADEGIPVSTLQWWMRKAREAAEPEAVKLREVEWTAAPPAVEASTTWGMELVSPRGWTLRRREALEAAEMARLLKSLPC